MPSSTRRRNIFTLISAMAVSAVVASSAYAQEQVPVAGVLLSDVTVLEPAAGENATASLALSFTEAGSFYGSAIGYCTGPYAGDPKTQTPAGSSDQATPQPAIPPDFKDPAPAPAPGADYNQKCGSETFGPAPDGKASKVGKTLTFTIRGDDVAEPNECFQVNLTPAPAGSVNPATSDLIGVVTIIDNKGSTTKSTCPVGATQAPGETPPPTPPPGTPPNTPLLTVSDAVVTEGNSGTTIAPFEVSLSQASTDEVRANFTTGDSTAQAPTDYATQFGQVVFAPGETRKIVQVAVNGDTTVEPTETFRLSAQYASGTFAVSDGEGIGTITNDDTRAFRNLAPKMSLSSPIVSRRALSLVVGCPTTEQTCTGTVAVTAGSTRLANGRFKLDGGKRTRVSMRLTSAGRRYVAGRSSIRFAVRARATDSTNKTRITARKFTARVRR